MTLKILKYKPQYTFEKINVLYVFYLIQLFKNDYSYNLPSHIDKYVLLYLKFVKVFKLKTYVIIFQ